MQSNLEVMYGQKIGILILLLNILALPYRAESRISERYDDNFEDPPNIIIFIADDLGWVDSQVYGSDFYETPAMNRLSKEGMRFTQAYAQPLCSPSRAAFLTGKYSGANFKMHSAITRQSVPNPNIPKQAGPNQKMVYPQSRDRLPLEEATIAERLNEEGYQTWFLGKWHLKPAGSDNALEKYDPVNRGFDVQVGVGGASPGSNYFAPYEVQDFPAGPEGEYISDRMANEALELIEKRYKGAPFFMYYSAFNVHSPYSAQKERIDYYTKKANIMGPGKHRNPIYAAMIDGLDQALAKILDKLDELEINDNTIIIFMSDNGGISWNNLKKRNTQPFNGYKKWLHTAPTSNNPLRGHKHTYYEGGVRVPLIVRWPDYISKNSITSTPVHIVDIFPTILEIINSTNRNQNDLDGTSLVPLFNGDKIKKRPLFCHFPRAGFGMAGGSFIREGDYKLIKIYGEGKNRNNRYELYNLRDDIGEKHDLSSKMPAKVNVMKLKLNQWLKETNALIPQKNPDYIAPQKVNPEKNSIDIQSLSE